MNVYSYFSTVFGEALAHDVIDSDQREDLESMPLDSNCGEDCKKAIDRAHEFSQSIYNAYGQWNEGHFHEVLNIAVKTCLVFICG
jgi:hypothetical protein